MPVFRFKLSSLPSLVAAAALVTALCGPAHAGVAPAGPGPIATIALGEPPGPVRLVSRLILGTDHLGKVPEAQAIAVLDEAVRLGITAFDTAPIYADDIERRLGRWLQARQRPDLTVITKGGFPWDRGPGTYDSRLRGDPAQIAANVGEELLGSRASYATPITVYLMHRDDADFRGFARVERPQTPALTIFQALSTPSLAQHYLMLGVSNWSTARVAEARQAARAQPGVVPPVCNSPYFSLFEMGAKTLHSGGAQVTHAEMLRRDFQPGVRLMTYSPLGGFSIVRPGWDAARARALALKTGRDRYWGNVYDALFHEANAARYARGIAFTERFNRDHDTAYTLDQLLNAYVMAHPRTDFVVIGPRTVEQLRRTVEAQALASQLTPGDLEFLYSGAKPTSGQARRQPAQATRSGTRR